MESYNQNGKENQSDQKNLKKVGVVETFAEDMAKVIETNEAGMVRQIIHEQEENEAIKRNLSPESSRNKTFMLVGIILIFLTCITIAVLVNFKSKISSVSVAPQFTPLIFTDKTVYKEIAGLSKDQIVQTILNEVQSTDVKSGGVEGIYFTENNQVIGFRRFMSLIQSSLATDQIAYINDNFLLGVVNDQSKDLFILLKTRSFVDVFPTMKSWENKIFSDLHGLFGIEINPENSFLLTKDFGDGIVDNKNAHVLTDANENTVFEYVFGNDTSVIITTKDEAAKEIVLRLSSAQIKR